MRGIRYLHKQIVIYLVYYITTFVNTLPVTLDVSTTYLARQIVTQHKLNMAWDCMVQFEAYVDTSEDMVITNDMASRTI